MNILLMITCIRKMTEREDNDINDLVNHTDIVSTIIEVLRMEQKSEVLFYIRLEAVWILLNLFFGDKEDVEHILQGGFVIQCIATIIEEQMKGLRNEGACIFDMRMITHIYFACCNLAETETQYSSVLLDKTSILDSMIEIILKFKKVPSDTARHMAHLTNLMAKSQLNC
jgi:hypothetical protein